MDKLREGCDILVAKPDRLLSILRRDALCEGKPNVIPVISLEELTFVVYDEADELL